MPGKHLLFASYKIAHAVRRGNGRLCISMPPRHGKSRLVGEAGVPWFLEEFPGRHVILISYNGDKAQEWGRKARDMIRHRDDLFYGAGARGHGPHRPLRDRYRVRGAFRRHQWRCHR